MRGSRPGKTVQMTESEVRGLCLKSRELFLQQPILLELEAPLKICGKIFNSVLLMEIEHKLSIMLQKHCIIFIFIKYCLCVTCIINKKLVYFATDAASYIKLNCDV